MLQQAIDVRGFHVGERQTGDDDVVAAGDLEILDSASMDVECASGAVASQRAQSRQERMVGLNDVQMTTGTEHFDERPRNGSSTGPYLEDIDG
ncbi:hypothetical protein ASJ79_00090 [Mycobacterium sp. NAZ190054]|nr:hypothetical protein ASJ79_00090 [Mycobacterium sp. NAZ190054]